MSEAPSEADVEAILKKRLQNFLNEMLKLGTTRGFKHFASYMRGREEMVISIINEPQTTATFCTVGESPGFSTPDRSGSLTSQNLPYDKRSLLISMRSQMSLSVDAPKGVGLPPASPSDQEIQIGSENSTIFLIAGYARYSSPYVWVRSNHDRLIKLAGGDSSTDKDSPLRMKTTMKWRDNECGIWDIIAELVKLCCYPPPLNPFEVDFDYFDGLPLPEKVITTGALIGFLQKVVVSSADQKIYLGKVFEELQILNKIHYTAIKELTKTKSLPGLSSVSQQHYHPQHHHHQQQQHKPHQFKHHQHPGAVSALPAKPKDQQWAGATTHGHPPPPPPPATHYGYGQY